MTKTRISISLDAEHVEQLKAHAERAGMDVSSYVGNAIARQMAETDAIEAQFASLDAAIAAAEAVAAELPAPPAVTDSDLTEQERREVEAAMELMYGSDQPAERETHQHGDDAYGEHHHPGSAA